MSNPNAAVDVVGARITRVVVFEDRADVVREVEVTLPDGACVLALRGLPAVLSDDHITATLLPLDGAAVGAAHVNDVHVLREVMHVAAASDARRAQLVQHTDDLANAVRRCDRAVHDADAARDAIDTTYAQWIAQLAHASGRGEALGADAWQRAVTTFEQAFARANVERDSCRRALAAARDAQLRAHTGAIDAPKHQAVTATLTLRVSAAAGRYRLRVSTLMPCAAWRPAHEATLWQGSTPRVVFGTLACVWQKTGEAWNDVELVLSTARPSGGAQMPTLHADRLTLRDKTIEEKRTIVVQHRDDDVPDVPVASGAPGVDDGGAPQVFLVPQFSVPSDGRPHRALLGTFESPCTAQHVAMPELAPQVFLRTTLKNASPRPILAGAVTLRVADADGSSSFVGTGDVLYRGGGETFDLSFGSDDRFVVSTDKKRLEDKKLVGKDVTHFIREATLTNTSDVAARVMVMMRMPISELKQLRVVPSVHLCTHTQQPDAHGIVRIDVELAPSAKAVVALAFSFDASSDVRVPDPW